MQRVAYLLMALINYNFRASAGISLDPQAHFESPNILLLLLLKIDATDLIIKVNTQ